MKKSLLLTLPCLAASLLSLHAQEERRAEPAPRVEVLPEEEEAPVEVDPVPDPAGAPVPRAVPMAESEAREEVIPAEEEPIEVRAVPREELSDEPREVRAVPLNDAPNPSLPRPPQMDEPAKKGLAISVKTDPNARPLSLLVPAPRGQIVDRHGRPLAQNAIAYYAGIQLPLKDGLTDQQILDAARAPVAWIQRQLPDGWSIDDAKIIDHYHKRRWLPFLASDLVSADKAAKWKDELPAGVVLRPFYVRTYPEHTLASQLMGGMAKSKSLPSGDILPDEMLWPPDTGAGGLEARFDKELSGTPGRYSVLYNSAGEKLSEEWITRPVAGNTVVTGLDIDFQRITERILRENGVRGAFVIMDVKTGDTIAMASNPGFDVNMWVHGISGTDYKKLTDNPEKPMLSRAFMGTYPPASTFKPIPALAALESGKVTPDTEFNCPTYMTFDGKKKWNWNKKTPEGSINVVRAIKRSCNPWFWQAARAAGGPAVASMASRFGFGDKTGICLESMEQPGFMPSPEWYQQRGAALAGGYLANIAIGQGEVNATPLQVCQMMAGIARGDAVPRPRLVRHIQSQDGDIVQNFPPSIRTTLNLGAESLAAVRRGMVAVVADSDGTGKRASNKYVTLAGKTGTGEANTTKDLYVAWFAGFVPAKNPEYAFACVYEGDRDESISGGSKVAPMVGSAFNAIYKMKRDSGEKVRDDSGDDEDDKPSLARRSSSRKKSDGGSSTSAPPEAPPPPPSEEKPGGFRKFWNKLRGK